MKRSLALISITFIILLVSWSFYSLMPRNFLSPTINENEFSLFRALDHVKAISRAPHYMGSDAHSEVRQYIDSELNKMGLATQIQEGYTAGNWGNFCKVQNILARIKGTRGGKALMLLAHYDSAPHSSYGASDDASGVAVILESVRAFLSSNTKPLNDIIILITDGEELGLDGAKLFVAKHPWAKEVGLILNFEARGSGGPGYMLIETNGGNSEMIRNFAKAHVKFPVSNSLAYSIYKLLPNDTDLTIFREDSDIDGFNFAFIDDHFDYHTALDNYERLDRNTLLHQGSYLAPLLKYFSNADLSAPKSNRDLVYFNFPFLHLVFYPFSWIIPMLVIAIAIFVWLVVWGKRNGRINYAKVGKGFIPFTISILITGIIGYFSWTLLTKIYPGYSDIQQGFTYNGYSYIAAFIFLSLGICFLVYHRYNKLRRVNLVVAPLSIWFVICIAVAIYLKGASFFIIPAYFALISFYFLIRLESPNVLLLVSLSIPTLWIFPPLLQTFPVALGLGMMVASTLISVLIFGLLLPVLLSFKMNRWLGILTVIAGIAFLVSAHLTSTFTTQRPGQTSLVYFFDADANTAFWASHNQVPDERTKQLIPSNENSKRSTDEFNKKYQTHFSKVSSAAVQSIPLPVVRITADTIVGNDRHVNLTISHQRKVNTVEIFANPFHLLSCNINGVALSTEYLQQKRSRLIRHFVSDNDSTVLQVSFSKNENLDLWLMESSYDLLTQKQFGVPGRPQNEIPMPFVLNDAVMVRKRIKL